MFEMIKTKKVFLLTFFNCFLVLFNVFNVFAEQKIFTLDDAIQTALQNNSSLKAQAVKLNQAERADKSAWNNFLPSISASGGISNSHNIYSSKELTADQKSSWSWSGSAGISLNLNSSIPFKIKQTSLQYTMAKTAYSQLESSIKTQVTNSFYNLTAELKNIEMLKENMNLAKDLLDQTQVNYNNGLASELELLRAKYSYQSIKPQITQAQSTYTSNAEAFMILLGLPAETKFSLRTSSTIQQLNLPAAKELADLYIENRFDVIQKREALASAELGLSVTQQNTYAPSISLRESISTGDKISKDNDGKFPNVNGSFSASISIPLDGLIPNSSSNLQVKNAKDSIKTAQIDLDSTIENARQDINKKVADVKRIYESLELNNLNKQIADRAYQLAAEGYRNGLVSQTDLASQRKDRLSAQQTLMQAEINYILSIESLATALNIPTSELTSRYSVKTFSRVNSQEKI